MDEKTIKGMERTLARVDKQITSAQGEVERLNGICDGLVQTLTAMGAKVAKPKAVKRTAKVPKAKAPKAPKAVTAPKAKAPKAKAPAKKAAAKTPRVKAPAKDAATGDKKDGRKKWSPERKKAQAARMKEIWDKRKADKAAA
jgi:hypothetical protein